MSEGVDSPGVRFPPPFVFVGCFLAGMAVHRLFPMPIAPTRWHVVSEGAGLILVIAGLLLVLSALMLFVRAHTSIMPHGEATLLVDRGVYRITRNPMYSGLALLHAGLALLINQLWPLLLLPVAVMLMQRYIIAREEAYLSRRFGAAYDAFRRRVPRWPFIGYG